MQRLTPTCWLAIPFLLVAPTLAYAQCNPAENTPHLAQAETDSAATDRGIDQADVEQARQTLNREQKRLTREESSAVNSVRQQTQQALDQIEEQDMPEGVERPSGALREASGQATSQTDAAGDDDGVTHHLFLSGSLPDSERRALIKELGEQVERIGDPKQVRAYLQGPLEGQEILGTLRTIQGWLAEAGYEPKDDAGPRPAIVLDSRGFDRYDVDVTPTWVSVRDGEVIARAEGVGDLDTVLRRAEKARERGEDPHLGRLGSAWPIEEPHIVDTYLPQRLQAWIEDNGGKRAILERGVANYWKHQPLGDHGLDAAEKDRTFEVDPSVKVTEDVYVPDPRAEGERVQLAAEGDRVNPLDAVPWTRPLVVFDATRRAERRWLVEWLDQRDTSDPPPILVLSDLDTKGDPKGGWSRYNDIGEELGRRVYVLPRHLRQRLELARTPSVVTATDDGDRLQVREYAVTPETAAAPSLRYAVGALLGGVSERLRDTLLPIAPAQAQMPDPVSPGDQPVNAEELMPDVDTTCHDADVLSRMFTDVCYECFLPVPNAIAGEDISGDAPSGWNKSPTCMCRPPMPGISTGGWLPARLVEVVRTPYCSPTLFGEMVSLDYGPGSTKQAGARDREGRESDNKSFYNTHLWAFPAGEIFGLVMGCESGADSLDMMFMSELDPAWNDDQVAMIQAPETAMVANPLAQLACTGEVGPVNKGNEPNSELYWCAGSWGSIYPHTGNINYQASPVSDSALLAARVIASMHRRGQMRKVLGNPCKSEFSPMVPKTGHRWSQFYPVPEKDNTHWTGESSLKWGDHRTVPKTGEDYLHMLWRWNDCCLEI